MIATIAMISNGRTAMRLPVTLDPHVTPTAGLPPTLHPSVVRAFALPATVEPDPAAPATRPVTADVDKPRTYLHDDVARWWGSLVDLDHGDGSDTDMAARTHDAPRRYTSEQRDEQQAREFLHGSSVRD